MGEGLSMTRPTTPEMRSRIRRTVAVAGTAGVMMGAVQAPAAQADSSACNPDCSAAAEWQSYGEVLTVHDYKANGRATVVLLDLHRDGSSTQYWNTNGYAGPPAVYDLELAEGIPIRYRVCENDNGAFVNCSAWQNDGT